jgi:hypothetical protein
MSRANSHVYYTEEQKRENKRRMLARYGIDEKKGAEYNIKKCKQAIAYLDKKISGRFR